MAGRAGDRPRIHAVLRSDEARVTPLELFFDLVFVLAITQCTALMADDPSWTGLLRGLLVLAALWWGWVGYAWLTSVVDPEEGEVRLVIFVAMAAMLVCALSVPEAFGDLGLTFALAYAVFRAAHIALFLVSSRDDPGLRSSTWGLAGSSALGVALLVAASFTDGTTQGALWLLAIALDVLGPYLFGSDGWHLVPSHFAERHGLVFIIALGESIVAIGVGASAGVDAGVITAAVLGVFLACTMWWAYFDVVALVAERRLSEAPAGRVQNEMARDSYSYLHYPMVAGVVLIALGLKTTLAHVDDPLAPELAAALVGGLALYLLAHVAFRYRNVRSFNHPRLVTVALLALTYPVALEVDALVALAIVTLLMIGLISYEATRFAEARDQIRHEREHRPPAP